MPTVLTTTSRRRRRTAHTAVPAFPSLPRRKRTTAVSAAAVFTSFRRVRSVVFAALCLRTAPVLASGPIRPPSTRRVLKKVQNKIRTDRTSYAHGDPLAVTFSAAGAATGDWVAIHPADADPAALHTTNVPWLWTCGSRLCFMGASAGTLAFDSSELDPGGSYRVHLIPEDGYRWKTQSYVASASSEVFFVGSSAQRTVVAPSNIPSGAPTEAPTALPSKAPSSATTEAPTAVPTGVLTAVPSTIPTGIPTPSLTEIATGRGAGILGERPTRVALVEIPTRVATTIPTRTKAKSLAGASAPAPVQNTRQAEPNVLPPSVRRRHVIKNALLQLTGAIPWPGDVVTTNFLRYATENTLRAQVRDDAAFHAVQKPEVVVSVQGTGAVAGRFVCDVTVRYIVDRTVPLANLPGDSDVRRVVVAALGGGDGGYAAVLRRWPEFAGIDGATLYLTWAAGAAEEAAPASRAYGNGTVVGAGGMVAVVLVAVATRRRRRCNSSVPVEESVSGDDDDGDKCGDDEISEISEITCACDEESWRSMIK